MGGVGTLDRGRYLGVPPPPPHPDLDGGEGG